MARGREVTLRVPGQYPHQTVLSDSPAPFKLARWGRRAGKTVEIFRQAVMGHGPLGADGEPIFRGLRHGLDVVWVGRSKDQARIIWNTEVRPRFEATGVADINETLLTASLPGFGKLMVKSQDRDSINNVRGMGATLGGIVGDEVAHWDNAEAVWLDVLLPTLTDNMGWATFVSTTEPGSWFNRQCAKAMSGDLPAATWFHTHATALDNPRISQVAFDRLLAEYPQGDPRIAKEIYAEITIGGAGSALDIRESAVMVPPWGPDKSKWPRCTFFGALDWGFRHPFSFGLYASVADGVVVRIDGVQAVGRGPMEIFQDVQALLGRYGLSFRDLDYTVAGGDVANERGKSLGIGSLKFSEGWAKLGWVVNRAKTGRLHGLTNFRYYLADHAYRICSTTNGLWALRQLQDRVLDDKGEDVRKDDARSDGTGGDDGYDEQRFALMSRPRAPEVPDPGKLGRDPLKELPQSKHVASSQHMVWNPDGTPCYISPETWEES